MAEESADFVLWGDECQGVEDQLDIPEDLRKRMKAWVREYSDSRMGMARPWTVSERTDHDRQGYAMSQELQALLGDEYFVDYHFATAQVRDEVRAS